MYFAKQLLSRRLSLNSQSKNRNYTKLTKNDNFFFTFSGLKLRPFTEPILSVMPVWPGIPCFLHTMQQQPRVRIQLRHFQLWYCPCLIIQSLYMSIYPDFIAIFSRFCLGFVRVLFRFCPVFVQISSSLNPDFVGILSGFCRDFVQILSRFNILIFVIQI